MNLYEEGTRDDGDWEVGGKDGNAECELKKVKKKIKIKIKKEFSWLRGELLEAIWSYELERDEIGLV